MATQHATPAGDILPPPGHVKSPALARLLATGSGPEPFSTPWEEIRALQIEAANDVIAGQRDRIRVLARRIEETGVSRVESLADIVPLLFAHTVYKSYPTSFLKNGQWDRMLRWFATLTSMPVDNVDLAGVVTVDDFILALHAAGHQVLTSSGTSGKVSFLDRNEADIEIYRRWVKGNYCWPKGLPAERLNFFQLTPRHGPYIVIAISPINAALFGDYAQARFLSDDRMLVGDLMRAAEMRHGIAEGTVPPSELVAYEEEVKAKAAKAVAQLEAIVDEILDKRHEPLFLMGQAGMLWRLVERARERGIGNGEFHPASVLATGGGAKGLKLPDDWVSQVYDFFGDVHFRMNVYGCSEMSVIFPACEEGHYHPSPWIIPLVLDREGETLLPHDGGRVEGRFGFLDLTYDSRWGGLITGDKVTMDYSPTCACGRPGPVMVAGSIVRYSDLGEEDKITCAGTMESYIRGAVE